MLRARPLATWLTAAALASVQICVPALPVLAEGPRTSVVAVGETGAQTSSPTTAPKPDRPETSWHKRAKDRLC